MNPDSTSAYGQLDMRVVLYVVLALGLLAGVAAIAYYSAALSLGPGARVRLVVVTMKPLSSGSAFEPRFLDLRLLRVPIDERRYVTSTAKLSKLAAATRIEAGRPIHWDKVRVAQEESEDEKERCKSKTSESDLCRLEVVLKNAASAQHIEDPFASLPPYSSEAQASVSAETLVLDNEPNAVELVEFFAGVFRDLDITAGVGDRSRWSLAVTTAEEFLKSFGGSFGEKTEEESAGLLFELLRGAEE